MADTLCWSCKKATCSEGHLCSWATNGIPVKGWVAEKGTLIKISLGTSKTKFRYEQSYCVQQCPLYEEDSKFYKISQFYKELEEKVGCHSSPHGMYLKRKLQEYQDLGYKIPEWIIVELEIREEYYKHKGVKK